MKKITSIAMILGLSGLAACASDAWTKEGVTPQAAAVDLADCNALAQSATQRDASIDTDIMATRGHDWQQTHVTQIERDANAAQTEDLSHDVISRCMIAKGYVPGP